MTSERSRRRIERLLDEAEQAADNRDWDLVRQKAEDVLAFDPENADARDFLLAANRSGTPTPNESASPAAPQAQPASFANGRYAVKRFLGEGGKKKVYLAHDASLDRDVAFALIKTEGLDDVGKERVTREAQAMGRLGDHPNLMTVYDIGEEDGQPYVVLPVMPGGDVEGLIEKAPEHKLPLEQAIKIAIETAQGLEAAHARGIVHRDIKPGNVWLAEDGRAKVGDFGLAVATDRTRLTQAGMMVGTVSYMPPEQAMGGEITARSDLYSLGAMLYEMVCGRPPFVGDESVAIIGQHLNTPPVAPTWHRPDCPPSLEALILRLLEKDPARRPESAAEVSQVLQSINHQARGRPQTKTESVSLAQDHDPLYRRTFVGRENEVRQLQQAFDAAISGNGALVMVVGEPGIGKTALCEQLATYVALRGGRALVGHCYEEGSLSLPYLAFVEALRSYVLARDPDGLRSDLGTAAADVARIVSEVRDRVNVELRAAGDPEDDRWRLLQAITSFLRNASTVQPLAIVLEDLHWADRGTLDLMLHVARNLQGARLLIIGTYRDVEVDRAHPLSGTLAELRRQGNFLRVPLRGLTIDEVSRMYAAIRGQEVSWAQAEAVHRQTEGNPLFIQEVIRYMVEEGYVVREGGRWVLAEGTVPGTGLPEGLRDVVGKRLSRLSEGCNRLLSVAAVIGRDFDLQTLRGIANLSEEDLLAGIEEAIRFGVLEERSLPGALRYRFAHAFFRTALYEEMIAARRLRLHQEVARALESQYASRREEHAAELAEHYGQSTDRADLAKAVEYSELASKRAMSVFAYAEAEQHLRRCLEVQEVLDPDDKGRRCDLLLAMGEAMLPQENPTRIAETSSQEAFDLATSLGDRFRAAVAATQALQGIFRGGIIPGTERGEQLRALNHKWVERADSNAEVGMRERVYADIFLGRDNLGRPSEAHGHFRKAVEGATNLSDNVAFFAASGAAFLNLLAIRDQPLLERLAMEASTRSRDGVSSGDLAICLTTMAWVFLDLGNREKAEEAWRDLAELAERSRDASAGALVTWRAAEAALINGHLEEALEMSEIARAKAQELGLAGSMSGLAMISRAKWYLGGDVATTLERTLSEIVGTTRPPRTLRALVLCYANRLDEAMVGIDELGDIGSDEDAGIHVLTNLLEASILCRKANTARSLMKRFASSGRRLVFLGWTTGISTGRLLGEAAVLLGQPTEARGYYAQALEVCQRVRFRPEIALIRLDLAELLLEHYPDEHEEAIEHLDFAIAEFREMKMQPSLERALRHRGLLKA